MFNTHYSGIIPVVVPWIDRGDCMSRSSRSAASRRSCSATAILSRMRISRERGVKCWWCCPCLYLHAIETQNVVLNSAIDEGHRYAWCNTPTKTRDCENMCKQYCASCTTRAFDNLTNVWLVFILILFDTYVSPSSAKLNGWTH